MSRNRLVPLALAVTALLALVAIVARGRPLDSSGGRGGLPLSFWDYVFTTVVIVTVVLLLLMGVASLLVRKGWHKPKNTFQRHMIQTLAVFVFLAMLGTILAREHMLPHLHFQPRQTGVSPSTNPGSQARSIADTRSPRLEWDEILTVLGLVLVVSAIYAVVRPRHPRRFLEPMGKDADALAAALDQSLDDLRTDPDLRRAIIAAYARMEAALAVAGVARRPAEAPLEYLERALLTLHASADSVRRLTDLFEWARFSHHEPEPPMRDDAVDALVAVRDELRASELIPA